MSLADRVLRRFGYERSASVERSQRKAFFGGATWAGADMGRLHEDWNPWTYSPNFEIGWVARFMRARARQLVRDNPYASGFLRSLSDNVVGFEGRKLRAKIKLSDGVTLASGTNKEIERAWEDWSLPETASADGKDSYTDIQRLHIETMAMDGEVIIRRLKGFDNEYGYALQFIDVDLLDETLNIPAAPGRNEIRLGVELDVYNRPVAYHIWNQYPTERLGEPYIRERIPASEILHHFVRYRANQVRGITWYAPILTTIYHLDGYEFAELVRARSAASNMGFIKNNQQGAAQEFDPLGSIDGKKRQLEDMVMEAGIFRELWPGQEVQYPDPHSPNTSIDLFTTTILRAVARGFNISHFTLTGDTRQANYSSMRVSLQPERDHWRTLQRFEATHFDRPVYADWIGMALLSGAVRVDSRLAADYRDVMFEGRGWKWVDPAADMALAEKEIRLGLNSRQRLAAEQGRDFEEIVEELAHENDVGEEKKVDISGVDIIREVAPSPDQGGTGEVAPNDQTKKKPDDQSGASPTLSIA